MALRTLRVLSRQATSMRRQTSHLRKSAIYARSSAVAAKRSADNDDAAARLTQRADVLLTLIEMQGANPFGPNTRIILHIKDYGPTRADAVVFNFRISIFGVVETGSPNLAPIVLGGGETQKFTFRTLGEITTGEVIDQIAKGKAPLRIFGKITYKDVFGSPHATECGATFNPLTWGFNAEETRSS